MKNNLEIEVVAYGTDGIGKIQFTYHDKEDNLIGIFEVNRKGAMNCSIYDEKYKHIIISAVSQIYGGKEPENLDKFAYDISEDPARWDRAKEFISQNGLELKYSEDLAMDAEEDSYNMHTNTR